MASPLVSLFLLGILSLSHLVPRADAQLAKERPIRLVKPSANHNQLEIDENGVKELMQMGGGMYADVVSVVGPYHSGKSFLLNNLLQAKGTRGSIKFQDGFKVGTSVDPTTHGLTIWGHPQQNSAPPEGFSNFPAILYVDTEGFSAKNVSSDYDSKVFAVATLLSNHLIYNGNNLYSAFYVNETSNCNKQHTHKTLYSTNNIHTNSHTHKQ